MPILCMIHQWLNQELKKKIHTPSLVCKAPYDLTVTHCLSSSFQSPIQIMPINLIFFLILKRAKLISALGTLHLEPSCSFPFMYTHGWFPFIEVLIVTLLEKLSLTIPAYVGCAHSNFILHYFVYGISHYRKAPLINQLTNLFMPLLPPNYKLITDKALALYFLQNVSTILYILLFCLEYDSPTCPLIT